MTKQLILFSLFFFAIKTHAQQRTYCNPMDIGYRYNFEQLNERISYRSGADPVIVNHKGEYYAFVTISAATFDHQDECLRSMAQRIAARKFPQRNREPFVEI